MTRLRQRFDQYAAAPMFAVTMIFLFCLSGILHLAEGEELQGLSDICLRGLLALYPLYVLEFLAHLALGSNHWKQNLLFCVLPPLRLGARDHVTGQNIWLPVLGWVAVDRELNERLERALSLPMIVIALMVLPLMGIEHFAADRVAANPWLALSLHAATGLIWLAFTAEFILMISVAERKIKYCKAHWIDLAVIMLPLVAFLRVGRLGRLLRLQQLTKTARMYRMRGVLMKLYRAVLLLDVIDRLLRGGPEQKLPRLRETLAEKEREIAELRQEITELEAIVGTVAPAAEAPPIRKAA